jgi:hypothetical protein
VADQFSDLSPARKALVRLFQSVNFGQIIGLAIRDGEPVFLDPEPTVLVDVKLDGDEGERPEADLADFTLRQEVRRFLAHLEQLKNGTVERVELRNGIPRRIVIKRRLTDVPLL